MSGRTGSRLGPTPASPNYHTDVVRVDRRELSSKIAAMKKAELHLHLEGSIRPAVAAALANRHNVAVSEDEVRERYAYKDFTEFIESFKWVTSLVREPEDFAHIAADLAEQLIEQNVVLSLIHI